MHIRTLAAASALAVLTLTGCSAVQALPGPATPSLAAPTPSSRATASASASETTAGAETPPSQTSPAPADTRAGAQLNRPYVVDGILVVNKNHRLGPGYVPAWASQPQGLCPDVRAAADRLMAAAKADGVPLKIRSGYRSYATQKASFDRAMRTQGAAKARAYYAEPGVSEHQTGLAFDLWDGRNRGDAFKRTPQAAWIAQHAVEYGFIVRYPNGRESVTGYLWEPWHLRYVGTDVARRFGPNATLTLEEFLGLS